MKRVWVAALTSLFALAVTASVHGDCTCAVAKVKNGWCRDCKVGYFDGVKLKHEKLLSALKGRAVDIRALKCESCRKALASDGFCKECNAGFVNKARYTSWVAYRLARGETRDTSKITCSSCQSNAKDSGWCDSCKLGMVGPRAFEDKVGFKWAERARAVLVSAASADCEQCAVAMVSNGRCDACNTQFKGGKKRLEVKKP